MIINAPRWRQQESNLTSIVTSTPSKTFSPLRRVCIKSALQEIICPDTKTEAIFQQPAF